SGIQPTGDIHLGNYLGAIRRWVEDQYVHDSFYCVVDLHALTMPQDPAQLGAKTLQTATVLIAAGLDPDVCTLFVQGHVPQHSELAWLLECTATFGELQRMIQFKEKSAGQESVRVGLFTYPVLQAADILLYDADRVPVGDDQRQHLELCRDLANRFNHHYGQTFVVPDAAIPKVGARVMDLQEPTSKMSKSASSPQGKIEILEDPATITRKIKRAVTDTGSEVSYDPATKPGVSNLLELLAVTTGSTPSEVSARYTQYGALKADTAEAVVEFLRPVQERYRALSADPDHVRDVLAKGATKAEAIASVTLARARNAVGLLPR
ncbi:MAG TPA: tryptophan--tRNA ligase, partial [Acidimicrobiales bacterium]|nr:tryptophan--tRNA ligase [Acidimicrobiales bacterium]